MNLAMTITGIGIEECSVTLLVTVDTQKDPHHYTRGIENQTQSLSIVTN